MNWWLASPKLVTAVIESVTDSQKVIPDTFAAMNKANGK